MSCEWYFFCVNPRGFSQQGDVFLGVPEDLIRAILAFTVFVFNVPWVLGSDPKRTIVDANLYMSKEKNPGCLGSIGDYTTQLYKD